MAFPNTKVTPTPVAQPDPKVKGGYTKSKELWSNYVKQPFLAGVAGTAGLVEAIPSNIYNLNKTVYSKAATGLRNFFSDNLTETERSKPVFQEGKPVTLSDTWGGKAASDILQYNTNLAQSPATQYPSIAASNATSKVEGQSATPQVTAPPAVTQQGDSAVTTTKGPSFYKNLSKTGAVTTQNASMVTSNQTGATPEFKNAIVSNEGSGSYSQIGSIMSNGENEGYPALGKYQIMPNIWFKSIGLNADSEADVNKFLNTPELQDRLFGIIMDDLSKTYNGDQGKMAAAYFGGALGAKNYGTPAGDVQGDGNMSVNKYVTSVLKKTGGAISGTSVSGTGASATVVPPSDFTKMSDADKVKYAISNGWGGDKLGLEAGQAAIGGTLMGVTTKYYEDARKMAGLPEMEIKLSKMKADDVDFRQTLEQYINGKDEVVSGLEKEIAMEEKRRPTLDMMNPSVAQQYNNHMAHLYALKGRQEQRYINYADNAVANFHGDIARQQADIESITNKVNELTTTNSAITKEVYETTATAMKGMYDEAAGADLKAQNMRVITANADAAVEAARVALVGGSGSVVGNLKDYKDVLDLITDKDGALNPGALTKNGIYGIIADANSRGQNVNEAASAVGTAIGNSVLSLDKDGNTNFGNIAKGRKLVTDYMRQAEGTPGLEESAKGMMDNFINAAAVPYASYIYNKIIDVQGAISDRMSGMDRSALSEKYPDLDSSVIGDIIDNIDANPTEEFKAQVTRVALSGSPSVASESISALLTTKW